MFGSKEYKNKVGVLESQLSASLELFKTNDLYIQLNALHEQRADYCYKKLMLCFKLFVIVDITLLVVSANIIIQAISFLI